MAPIISNPSCLNLLTTVFSDSLLMALAYHPHLLRLKLTRTHLDQSFEYYSSTKKRQ
uniref:Uncharacterized protein n=1 Tax=Arundo donax TaxID=35708 RepID=A0A0A9HP57_ARUDO